MKRHIRVAIGTGLALVLLGGATLVLTSHFPLLTQRGPAHATYYCPMHPSYTSDHPGDCPICNMKLVKREPGLAAAARDPHERASAQFTSICYLHNCAKLHEGKPCPMTVVAKAGEKVTCPICGTHIAEAAEAPKARTILYWTDPMIPGYKAPGPGKSPMGMDLVPVYAEETPSGTAASAMPEGYAPVLITPQKQQLIGIRSAPVERRKLTKTIRAAGTIAHDPELYQAQAEYLQANRTLEQATQGGAADAMDQAKRLVDSARIRLKHLGLSDELIEEIATWTEPQHSLLYAHAGEPVWMYAQVYEYELPLIHVGQELAVEVPSLPGRTFTGAIRAIDQMVTPETRTTRIRAELQDPEGQLKPDMYVNAAITVELGEVLAVPEEAVFSTGEKTIVFVDQGQGLFEPRDVALGAKADGYVEVTSGLAAGEVAVTSGNFLIDSESRLKGAFQSAAEAPEHPHGQ